MTATGIRPIPVAVISECVDAVSLRFGGLFQANEFNAACQHMRVSTNAHTASTNQMTVEWAASRSYFEAEADKGNSAVNNWGDPHVHATTHKLHSLFIRA